MWSYLAVNGIKVFEGSESKNKVKILVRTFLAKNLGFF